MAWDYPVSEELAWNSRLGLLSSGTVFLALILTRFISFCFTAHCICSSCHLTLPLFNILQSYLAFKPFYKLIPPHAHNQPRWSDHGGGGGW